MLPAREVVGLRSDEHLELDEAADRAGLSLSAWIRRVLLRAAHRSRAR